LEVGATLTLRQPIHVGNRSDAAVITDRFYSGSSVTASFNTANVGVNVTDSEGRALTHARAALNGTVRFTLPADVERAVFTARTPWDRHEREVAINGDTDLGEITLAAPTTVQLPRGETMSLTFVRAEGPQAVFHDNLFFADFFDAAAAGQRRLRGPESPRVDLAGTGEDPATVTLPQGRYTVYATRGPEFSVTRTELALTSNEATLDIAPPQRVLATPGLVNADFHLHSGLSFDASISPQQRVTDFVAQGGEVLTATEHNVTYDIAPVVEAMGLAETVFTLPGVEITGMVRTEVTPTTIAHSNVFPVPADTNAFMGGTLPFENRRLGQVIGDYKARYPGSIYQLNHAREASRDDDLAFFNHLSQGESYDPTRPLNEMPNAYLTQELPGTDYRDIDFDAMELLNGKAYDLYEVLREDWFSLLKQNHYKVATANSDSHKSSTIAAYPRNMLVVANDDVAELTASDVLQALKKGRLYGTTGPMLEIELAGAGPGETVQGTGGELVITARCADWVNVNEARVWVNGEIAHTLALQSDIPVRLQITVASDSFVFVEVEGQAADTYKAILPGFHPFAFANPVFIDVRGDGWRFGDS
ncbi:MAG: CehA/McbA family metallohydrolase, partial [Halioglobus sp.]|nr:CehA/McbA family metallohydrolase [Halioglobus sp.]